MRDNSHMVPILIACCTYDALLGCAGGMLAIRYALIYPTAVEQLVLVDPIGLDRAAGSSFAAKSPVLRSLITERPSAASERPQKHWHAPASDRDLVRTFRAYTVPSRGVVRALPAWQSGAEALARCSELVQ